MQKLDSQFEKTEKLSWVETAQAMAASGEDWTDWEAVAADGLSDIPFEFKPRSKPKRFTRSG